MSVKTKESIKKKWEKKVNEMKIKADFKYRKVLQNRKRYYEENWGYEIEKVERKKASYIKKMEEKYHRNMMNEIRELENKPPKIYK